MEYGAQSYMQQSLEDCPWLTGRGLSNVYLDKNVELNKRIT